MDNNHDPEQALQVDHQMRSIRSQWVRLVLARTVLLMMVPFGGLCVLSLYFDLISLSNVIMAFAVTYIICSVLIVCVIFYPVMMLPLLPLWLILSLSSLLHGLAALFCTSSYLLMLYFAVSIKTFQNIFYKPIIQALIIFSHHIILSCMALVLTARHVFSGRAHQLRTVRNAAYLLSYQITFLYLYILAILPIAKRHYLSNLFDWIFFI